MHTERAAYVRDALGRSSDYKEYEASGTTVAYERSDSYNSRGDVLSETVTSVITTAAPDGTKQPGTYVSTTSNDYGAANGSLWNGAYQGGIVTHSRTTTTLNGSAQPTSDTVNGYGSVMRAGLQSRRRRNSMIPSGYNCGPRQSFR